MSPTKNTKTFFVDVGERVGSTFAQVFLATLLASAGIKFAWGNVVAIAAFAALGSLLTSLLLWAGFIKAISNPYVDLVYRAVVTFGQTLLGLVSAAGLISALAFDWHMALKASFIAAGTSLLKGLIGLNNPSSLGVSPLVRRPTNADRPLPHRHLVA